MRHHPLTVLGTVILSLIVGCAGETAKVATTRPAEPKPDMTPVVAANSVVQREVAYVAGGAEKQKLDIYAPAGAKSAAIVIFIHGGEWTKGDKTEISFKPRFFNEHGIVFISANYRLSGTDKHPAQVNDVAAAVRWVRDHAEGFGGDGGKIVLMGHSAGCHLATLTGLDPRPLAKVGLRPSDLRGVVSWSGGAFDLVEKVNSGGMYATYIRLNFGDRESAWRDASPMTHVGDSKPMPRFLFASAGDGNASSRIASEKMVSLIQSAGGRADSIVLEHKTHTAANHEIGMAGDTMGQVLLRFVTEVTSQ